MTTDWIFGDESTREPQQQQQKLQQQQLRPHVRSSPGFLLKQPGLLAVFGQVVRNKQQGGVIQDEQARSNFYSSCCALTLHQLIDARHGRSLQGCSGIGVNRASIYTLTTPEFVRLPTRDSNNRLPCICGNLNPYAQSHGLLDS